MAVWSVLTLERVGKSHHDSNAEVVREDYAVGTFASLEHVVDTLMLTLVRRNLGDDIGRRLHIDVVGPNNLCASKTSLVLLIPSSLANQDLLPGCRENGSGARPLAARRLSLDAVRTALQCS